VTGEKQLDRNPTALMRSLPDEHLLLMADQLRFTLSADPFCFRLRQDGQHFAVDLVAPTAAFYHVPQREQETAATWIGENALQCAVARLAPLFNRLAQIEGSSLGV
jgi:hypothetical protein